MVVGHLHPLYEKLATKRSRPSNPLDQFPFPPVIYGDSSNDSINDISGNFGACADVILGVGFPTLRIKCGPLLQYISINYYESPPIWCGQITLVTVDLESSYSPVPSLTLTDLPGVFRGSVLHKEQGCTFWRFPLYVALYCQERPISYSINGLPKIMFWVPGADDLSMRMVFHSCNGFSLKINPSEFSGKDPLWTDVLRLHRVKPFHIMIGGGDQIYNDNITERPLFKQWLSIKSLEQKRAASVTAELVQEMERHYFEAYCKHFSEGAFGLANRQIPMVNIWDDHDIIDGYGSYDARTLSCPVFSTLGNIAFKYYVLFQHGTTVEETEEKSATCWVYGSVCTTPPHIKYRSRSFLSRVGASTVLLGIDNPERDQICSNDTYTKIFVRLRQEIESRPTRHLIILLGVPIAYPRLVWLENILTSQALLPLKTAMRVGFLKTALNPFDHKHLEILDDLDGLRQRTAKHHKRERNWFIQELQKFSFNHKIRITILGGDVHLCAMGVFYSNPKMNLDISKDHRYMVNVISSAIVNAPPPELMSDSLFKRNKVHHLDSTTDEDMIPLFIKDVDGKYLHNKCLLPRRNYCTLVTQNRYTASKNRNSSSNGESTEALEVVLRVEIDQHDPRGYTKPYPLIIPELSTE